MVQKQLFDDIFYPQRIHEILFLNVKSILTYPTLILLESNNKVMFERWKYLSQSKYDTLDTDQYEDLQKVYEKNAPYYPEYSKIVAITYGTVYIEDGKLKRYMKKIVNNDEFIVLATFMDELFKVSSDGIKSTPNFFPILCGHNIIGYDIPLLMKKFIQYNDRFETNKTIPLILKKSLTIKPWESGIIDTLNVWKFNGYDNMPLMLISDYLGLKKTVDLLPLDEMSKKYWELYDEDIEKAMEFVSLQSATQTNLVIQLINTLRVL
jgi:3'-5' exonuclease